MTYPDAGGISSVVLAAGDQLSRPGIGGVVATGGQTNGDLGLFRSTMASGSQVRAHFHLTFSESLVEPSNCGTGTQWKPAAAGDLIHAARGAVHGLRVPDDTSAEVLTLFTPGVPRERFVLELLEFRDSGRTLTVEEWESFYRRHDQYMV